MINGGHVRTLFRRLSEKSMQQVFSDWETLVGFQAKATDHQVQQVESKDDLLAMFDAPHHIISTQIEGPGDCNGPTFFLFPNTLVVEVIADLLMIPEAARESKAVNGLDADDLEGFQEMANLLCGSANQVFMKLRQHLRISQSVDDLKVTGSQNEGYTDHIPEGQWIYIGMQVNVGEKSYDMIQAIPLRLAIQLTQQFVPAA